MILQHRSKAPT